MRLTFGGVILDTDARQLLRGAEPVSLSPKAFDLLVCLVENRPSALSKDVLHDRLWPGLFVSDTNLAGLVAEIRRALGDDARTPRFVRTVQRFGYAFAGTVESEGFSATLKGRPTWSPATRLLAGARNASDPPRRRREHPGTRPERRSARLEQHLAPPRADHRRGASAYLEDLGSKNGTFLRGRSVSGRETLADGDTIKLGAVAFVFRAPASDRSTRTWKKGKRPYDSCRWRTSIDGPCLGDSSSCILAVLPARRSSTSTGRRGIYRRTGHRRAGGLPGPMLRVSWADAGRQRRSVASRRELPEELGRQVARRARRQDPEHHAAERAGEAHPRAGRDARRLHAAGGEIPGGQGCADRRSVDQADCVSGRRARAGGAGGSAAQALAMQPMGNLAQIMRGILFPSSNIIFSVQGQDPGAPKPPYNRTRAGSTGPTGARASIRAGSWWTTPRSRLPTSLRCCSCRAAARTAAPCRWSATTG